MFNAETYNMTKESIETPLIAPEEPKVSDSRFGSFKRSSLILGLLVGFFIQFSTLGANFLVITVWGEDVINKSRKDIVTFSLLWSFFTSAMAIVILSFLRHLVVVSFQSSNKVSEKGENLLEDMVLHMECRFVVGALVGVCMAWTMTDIILGMKAQIVYSIATLVVALVWCRIMMYCFTRNEKKDQDEKEDPILIV